MHNLEQGEVSPTGRLPSNIIRSGPQMTFLRLPSRPRPSLATASSAAILDDNGLNPRRLVAKALPIDCMQTGLSFNVCRSKSVS